MNLYKPVLIVLLLMLFAGRLLATHYYGADLFYTHLSGNTYKLTIVSFGDCSGAQFPTFPTTRPRVHIQKGNADFIVDYLDHEPPKEGIEVTPVCPEELKNTNCVNPAGTVPGVKKFVYSKEFTLSGPAPDWKFVFFGGSDLGTHAGRSNSLTNVFPVGVIKLEATLNNTNQHNSSPLFTTVATPFYCINRPVNFNPGSVDADGDSLVYELVPALDSQNLTAYLPAFSAGKPLDIIPGKFSFSSSTGQLSFTPGVIQRSLVVYRVSEYRKGVLLGTCMREMTVVVMDCNNNPPAGYISNASGAAIIDPVTVKTCKGNHEVSFDIDPADADGHTINMEVNGLPKGSKLDITNNNTTQPRSRFVWNMPDLPDGDYIFYITYTDDGCPIASKQTQAYTIRIGPEHILTEIAAVECDRQGLIKVIAPPGWVPWSYVILRDEMEVYSKFGIISNAWSDSIPPGKYKVAATNYLGCTADTIVDLPYDCEIVDLPTAFSPNGDRKNDILFVRGNVGEMQLRIYNRWGELVFESHDINTGWDGKYKQEDASAEAYAYVLSGAFKSGRGFYKKGNVTLLR